MDTMTHALTMITAKIAAESLAAEVVSEMMDVCDIAEVQGTGSAASWRDAISVLVSGEDGYCTDDVIREIEHILAD